MYKLFLTGHNGMIARGLDKQLSHKYDIMPDIYPTYNDGLDTERFHFNVKDYTQMRNAINDWKPDAIIHIAAVVGTHRCINNEEETILTNVLGTQNIIKICREFDLPLINFSSTTIFDPFEFDTSIGGFCNNAKPFENHPSLYGITKKAAEDILFINKDIDWFNVRPVFVCGVYPYDNSSMINLILRHIRFHKKEKLDIYLEYNKYKDYFYIDDFSKLLSIILDIYAFTEYEYTKNLLITKKYIHKSINLAKGVPVKFEDIVDYIKCTYGWNNSINIHDTGDYLGDHICDMDYLEEMFEGIYDEYSIEYQNYADIIDKIWESMKE